MLQKIIKSKIPILSRLASGLILVALGVAMMAISWSYPQGRLTEMGPGFMPHLIALSLVAMGIAVAVSDLRDIVSPSDGRKNQLHWRSLIFITGAVVVFVGLVEAGGLVPAMFCAVAVSMLANPSVSVLSMLVYSAAVTFAGWFLFLIALGLPLSAFGR